MGSGGGRRCQAEKQVSAAAPVGWRSWWGPKQSSRSRPGVAPLPLIPLGCARACGVRPWAQLSVRLYWDTLPVGHSRPSVAIWMDFLVFSTPHLRKARLGSQVAPSGWLWFLLSPCPGAKMPAYHSFSPLSVNSGTPLAEAQGRRNGQAWTCQPGQPRREAGNCFPAPKAAGLCVDTDSSCLPRTASPPPDPGLSDVLLSCSLPRALTCACLS